MAISALQVLLGCLTVLQAMHVRLALETTSMSHAQLELTTQSKEVELVLASHVKQDTTVSSTPHIQFHVQREHTLM